jgi:hypothetical protein
LRACVRTRRPVVFDGVVAVVLRRVVVVLRRAAGLRLRAGAFLAAGLLAAGLLAAGLLAAGFDVAVVVVFVVVLVFSAMWLFPPALKDVGSESLFASTVPGEHMYVNRSPGRVTAVLLSLYQLSPTGA